jgi:hypothetical protein
MAEDKIVAKFRKKMNQLKKKLDEQVNNKRTISELGQRNTGHSSHSNNHRKIS